MFELKKRAEGEKDHLTLALVALFSKNTPVNRDGHDQIQLTVHTDACGQQGFDFLTR